MMSNWTGSAVCSTALEMIDSIAKTKQSSAGQPGLEAATGLEGAFMDAIGHWLDGLKTWIYEAKQSIAAAAASAISAVGAFKAFRHMSIARSYFKISEEILKSPAGKQALEQMADPKHKSLYNKISRWFTGGKDLTHLVAKSEQFAHAGKSNVKLAALTAVMSIVVAIGVGLSINKLKSTPYAIDQILKLPLPTTKVLYDEYVHKVSTIISEHSYITIDGYVTSAIVATTPTEQHIEEKITTINAISTSLRNVPERIAFLAKSDAAKTQFGRKGLHFSVIYLEKLITETTALASHTERETEHLSNVSSGAY